MFNVPPQTEDLIEVGEGEKREINIKVIRNKKEKTNKRTKREKDFSYVFIVLMFLLLFLRLSSRKQQAVIQYCC